MFYSSRVFNQNIGGWDTAKVTTMRAMFRDARKFNQNISGWNTSKVKIMRAMFYSNSNSGTSRTVFNQNISGWNVGNVTDIHSMFFQSKFNKNISGWNVSKVSIYDNYGKYSNHTNAQFSDSSLLYFTVIKPGYTLSDEIEMINVSSGTSTKTGSRSLSDWLSYNDGITVTQATTASTTGRTNGIDNPNRVGYFTDSSGTQFKIIQCWDGHTMGGQTYGTLEHMFTRLYGWYPNSNGYWWAGNYGMAVLLGYGGNDPTWYYGMGEYTNRHDRSRHTYTNQIAFPTPIVIRNVTIISTTGGDF